ncbi:hypothetical protein HK405_006868 [Cladochytrium tenue]|nr:hypothetical protein HK405_006868 [Cladochytrium tenue]
MLGHFWESQGKCAEAETYLRQALATFEARADVLGPCAPPTMGSRRGLIRAVWRQGRVEEAEALVRRARELIEQMGETKFRPRNGKYSLSLYRFEPSKNAALTAAAIYFVLLVPHIAMTLRARSWYMIAAIICIIAEFLGYLARYESITQPYSILWYAIQNSLIIVSPVFAAATQYIILGRIIEHVAPDRSPLSHTVVAKLFVGGDIISFFIQGMGSSLYFIKDSLTSVSTAIMLFGLATQILSFSCFLALAMVFYSRAKDCPGPDVRLPATGNARDVKLGRWRRLFVVLVVGALAILVRSVFRVVEYSQGFDNAITRNEALVYSLDFFMVVSALLLLLVAHPGWFLPNRQGGMSIRGSK